MGCSRRLFEYWLLQVVPRVDRNERINAGVMLWCAMADFLDALYCLGCTKLHAIDPTADCQAVAEHLVSIEAECRGSSARGSLARCRKVNKFSCLLRLELRSYRERRCILVHSRSRSPARRTACTASSNPGATL
ncbi:MAG: hypothetical protein CMQ29_04720 [Gammaproteobacteria bacterium]|nr:hypothetical protein [Gammaproteobacteria bacterium]